MNPIWRTTMAFLGLVALCCGPGYALAQQLQSADLSKEESKCKALADVTDLTIISAGLRTLSDSGTQYCYVRGIIAPGIQYHVQLPLPQNWNERFLNVGDGGKDGVLNFADHRVAQGYAATNSNMGHDSGSEPGSSFGFNNRQEEIDFAYRAVHLTVNAAKTLIRHYYGKPPKYSYHEGCSTGGREGLMEAQRFPYDFDGIVAGDPVNYYQQNTIGHIWNLQSETRNNYAGILAFDTNGDGKFESVNKVEILRKAVLEKCDALDGIKDGIVAYPPDCHFDPDVDLASKMCSNDVNADNCFTKAQIQSIKDFYRGPHDSKGKALYWGKSYGWEFEWARRYIPHTGNRNFMSQMLDTADHLNYLFYENDPGVPPPNLGDLSYKLDKKANPPEWAWWEFNFDDYSAGKGDFMKSMMAATDPDLTRFLIKNNGKFILYHGWGDGGPPPLGSVTYYENVVKTTFGGNMNATRERIRLFMVPGMGHCRGGPGCDSWDKLAPLVDWVEKGKVPDFLVATHSTNGKMDNERPLCPYPQRAVYAGPGNANDPANWVAKNFTCR